MKVVVVGDCSISPERLEEAAKALETEQPVSVTKLWWGSRERSEMQKQQLNLETNGPEAEPFAEGLEKEIQTADILLSHLAPVPRKIIQMGSNLKLIGTCRGGTEQIDLDAAAEMGIPVIHVIRNAEATSDFAVGLMFAETRNIARSHAALKGCVWRKEYVNSSYTMAMRDMTVGIVGLGHVGKLVAEKVLGIGMKCVAYDPYVAPEALAGGPLEKVGMLSLEELFSQADIVSLHMRLTDETRGMIGEDLIARMKPTAYLVNTSRAGVLDREALLTALQKRTIGGTALDVFWDEPLREDDPLLTLDNVTITSHLAGNVVDALPRSPMLLAKTINAYWQTGKSDMLVRKKN